MAPRTLSFNRCWQTSIFLAVLAFPVSAYTPPATPNLPLTYEFTGLGAVAESTEFYNTQCDSNDFSWYGVDWACATGDPTNPVCIVKMAYHSTDANGCQDYIYPEIPNQNLTPDVLQEGSGDNKNLIEKLELMRIQDFNKNASDDKYQNTDLALSRQTNSLLNSLSRTLSYANDNRSIVDAINQWGATLQVNAQNLAQSDKEFWSNRFLLEDFNFDNYLGGISGQLSALDQIAANTAGGGSGGGSFPDEGLTYLDRIMSNTNTLKNSFAGFNSMASALMPEQNNLLRQIDASIKALDLGQGAGDNSDVVDALSNTNNLLTDIKGSLNNTVSSVGCQSFTCSQNNAQCYLARKEWEKSCASQAQDAANQTHVNALAQQLDDFVKNPDSDIQNIDAGRIDTNSLINHYNSSNGFNVGGASTCPPPYQVNAGIAEFTIDLSPFCDLAVIIRWFVIAFATVGAGLMISKYS